MLWIFLNLRLIQVFIQSYNMIWLHFRVNNLHVARKCFCTLWRTDKLSIEIYLFIACKDR